VSLFFDNFNSTFQESMVKKRKVILYIAGGIAGLILIGLLLKFVDNKQISSRIPEIPDNRTMSAAVKEQISEALAKAQKNPSPENLGNLGMVYHSSAFYEQATQCYELAAGRGKSGWKWNYYNGYLKMEMGESEAVINEFSKVLKKNPGIRHARYYIGEEYRNLRKNELAEQAFTEIVETENTVVAGTKTTRFDHFPLVIYARFQLSRIYYDNGQNDLAEKTLKEIIKSNNLFGPAYRLLGNIYSIKGGSGLSKKYIARANDLLDFSHPVDTLIDKLVLMSRSELYLLKKIDEASKSIYSDWALKLVNNGLNYIPENKYVVSKAVQVYLWKNLDQEAFALMDKHISLFHDSFSELNSTASYLLGKRYYKEAVRYWDKALLLRPEDTEALKNLSTCYYSMGDRQKSHDILYRLLDRNKNNPDVLADILYHLFHLGARDEAIGYLKNMNQIPPENPKVQEMNGEIAQANGEYDKAVAFYEASFRGDPEDLRPIRYLGNLLIRQKNWGKYISLYREALQVHPNSPEILERLGTVLINCPDYTFRNIDEGKEFSERAFTHKATPPDILVASGRSLAIAQALLGDKQSAISSISKTINIARRENISQPSQAELENILKTFQNM